MTCFDLAVEYACLSVQRYHYTMHFSMLTYMIATGEIENREVFTKFDNLGRQIMWLIPFSTYHVPSRQDP